MSLIACCNGQSSFGNACGVPANAKKLSEALAEVPQTPKSSSRHLRKFRKHQKVFRDTCGVPANTKKFFEALARFPAFAETFAQAARGSRHSPRRLRGSRKHQKVFRGSCSIPASISKSSALPLALYQRHSSGIRIPILSPNSRLECVSYRFFA